MMGRLGWRLLSEVDSRLLALFAWNLGAKGALGLHRFNRRNRRGQSFPAFVFISVTNECNLSCQGCWVTPTKPPQRMDGDALHRIIEACKRQGSHFFGILGGEPLLYPGLLDLLSKHRDCYFQLFTNGTTLTEEVARALRDLGHVTPLISLEGLEDVSDERRGGRDVYARAMEAIERCHRNRLLVGVATSVCRSNRADLVSEGHLHRLIQAGVHYVWYYIYRPVGPHPAPHLALNAEEIIELRRFMVTMRCRLPILIVDAYWDHEGRALCPAATGISHHISPAGDIEPCPAIQFAKENIAQDPDLFALFDGSRFLKAFRKTVAETTRGCIILERPDLLKALLEREGAKPSSGRADGWSELDAMSPLPGHHLPGREIPEKSWVYRVAKRVWFFGFGAYG